MLWYYEKLSEDDASVLYAYGWNTKETTGQLLYDKTSKKITIIKIADNDNQKGAEWAACHLPDIFENGYPEKDFVIIG